MTDGPLVSVILPVRNRAALIEAAARCVLDQTMRALELIVVDGGSTDGTVDVLRRLEAADARVRLVLHGHAEGVSAARNAGARLARAPWLAFQDSDDAWAPRKLELQLEALRRLPGARMAYCGARRTIPDGVEQRPPSWEGKVEGDLHEAILAFPIAITPALVVERALFEEVGGFDEGLRMNEDWDLSVRLSARTPVACAKAWLVDSARGPDSLSADRKSQLDSLARMAKTHEPFLLAHPRVHERRLADAGWALVLGGTGGLPLLRKAFAVRPFSLHGPIWASALRVAGGIVRRRLPGRRAGDKR